MENSLFLFEPGRSALLGRPEIRANRQPDPTMFWTTTRSRLCRALYVFDMIDTIFASEAILRQDGRKTKGG